MTPAWREERQNDREEAEAPNFFTRNQNKKPKKKEEKVYQKACDGGKKTAA